VTMTSPEQLERETEQARSQIAGTLEELRACLKPGQLVNELADRVGDAGARISRQPEATDHRQSGACSPDWCRVCLADAWT